MGAGTRRCAVDTNFLIDLASETPAAQGLLGLLQGARFSVIATHTVLHELGGIAQAPRKRAYAEAAIALQNLRGWQITAVDLIPVGRGICSEFAENLIKKGLLPNDEFHDGVIVVEAAFLISSDAHLAEISPGDLKVALTAADLGSVDVVKPRNFFNALRARRLK
jgi:predicted nucleic acid-binding protein